MQKPNLFSFNDTVHSPDAAEALPLLIEYYENVVMGAMSAGKVTKSLNSSFGKGKGTPLFVIPAKTRDATDNAALSYSVAVGTTDGTISITQHSTNTSATSNITNSFLVVGKVDPVSVAQV